MDYIIYPATPALRAEALQLVLSDSDSASEQAVDLLAAEDQRQLSLAGLCAAYRKGKLVAATWALAQPGRTALVWPPRLAAAEPESTADALLESIANYLAGAGIRLAQAVLPEAAGIDAQRLLKHGFFHAADLLYLASSAEQLPQQRPSCRVQFDVYTAADEGRLAALIDQTYQQTCDCPELNGVREPADVLEGYRQTGVFSPERWLIAKGVGSLFRSTTNSMESGETEKDSRPPPRDLGCLLLADHPAQDQWELVYMGLVPQARGRGLGLDLTRHAQWLTRQAGRSRLVLAVDARNEPALAIYSAVGFEVWDRRSVLLKVCGPGETAARFS